jgi:hypothetical protein
MSSSSASCARRGRRGPRRSPRPGPRPVRDRCCCSPLSRVGMATSCDVCARREAGQCLASTLPRPPLASSAREGQRSGERRQELARGRAAVEQLADVGLRVPRSGSSVGTRCSASLPGTSKMTESHEAAATSSGYDACTRPGTTRGCPRGLVDGGLDLGVGRPAARSDPRACSRWARPLSGRGRRCTAGRPDAAARRPSPAVAVAVALAGPAAWPPSRAPGHDIGSASSRSAPTPTGEDVGRLRVEVGAVPVLDELARPARGTPAASDGGQLPPSASRHQVRTAPGRGDTACISATGASRRGRGRERRPRSWPARATSCRA